MQHAGRRVDQDALVAAAVGRVRGRPGGRGGPAPSTTASGMPRFGVDGAAVRVAGPAGRRRRSRRARLRGASPASCTFMPKSIRLTSTCTCPCGCMSPPMTPKTNHGLPSFVTIAGMIVWNGRLCGSRRLGCFVVEGEQACRGSAARSRGRRAPGRSRSRCSCSGSATRSCGPCPRRTGRWCRPCRASGRRPATSVSAFFGSISLRRAVGVRLRDQLGDRHLGERRVGVERGAVGEGQLLRLDEQVPVVRRVRPHLLQVVAVRAG